MIGTEITLLRISVTMSAVADKSGRRDALFSFSVITTSKSIAACCPADCCDGGLIAELPISVTHPEKYSLEKASIA